MLERNLEPGKRKTPGELESMTIRFELDMDDIYDEESVELAGIFLSELFNNFTWTGLCELDLSSLECASPQVLASTFGTVPHLRIIVADSDIAPWLIKALNHRPDAPSNPLGSSPLPFPGLQHIGMGGTKLSQSDKKFKVLHKHLQQRHESGIPIISLKFDHALLVEGVVPLLKKYVGHIVFKPSGSEHGVLDDCSPYNHDWYI